jgi:ribosome-binding protein aMBF1 (putative translation factor)
MNILNERQYRVTKAAAERFAQTLAAFDGPDGEPGGGADMHPLARQAMRDSLESQVRVLRQQMAEYERERFAPCPELPVTSLDDLPEILIRSRISAHMTQRDLAMRLHLKEQQVQRWEQTRYKGVSWERLQSVLGVLDVQLMGQARRGCHDTTASAAD